MSTSRRTSYSQHFDLDPEVTFLNHGSFGATPRAISQRAARVRQEVEREPVDFFMRHYLERLDRSRAVLARFLEADPAGLVFVPNATTGVNCVLGSIELAEGDELLVTDHVYNACRNALVRCAERSGATVVVAPAPFPLEDEAQVVEAVRQRLSPRTRLALIDHVTSPTGVVLPIEAIAELLHARGVDLLVDGAHAPGMLPLALDRLGVAWYVGNCHKWLCAPKGAGFLYARSDKRASTRPVVTSHGANAPVGLRSRFQNEFDWPGTQDPAPWLCVGDSIEHLGSLHPGGWPGIQAANRALALEARAILCEALRCRPPAPESMIGSLASVPIPDGGAQARAMMHVDPLQQRLWEEHRIEVPIMTWPAPPRRLLRVSAQVYNARAEYEHLARTLLGLLAS